MINKTIRNRDFSSVHIKDRTFTNCTFINCKFGMVQDCVFIQCRIRECTVWSVTRTILLQSNIIDVDLRGNVLNNVSVYSSCIDSVSINIMHSVFMVGSNLTNVKLESDENTTAKASACCFGEVEIIGNVPRIALVGNRWYGDCKMPVAGKVVSTAIVQFTEHGELGRELLAIRGDKDTTFSCGCFYGTEKELRKFIALGRPEYKQSRLKALNTVLGLL